MTQYRPPHHVNSLHLTIPSVPSKSHSLPSRGIHNRRQEYPDKYSPRPAMVKPASLKPPVSLDIEHRWITSTASHIITTVKSFKSSHRLDNINFAKCKDTALDILQYSEKSVHEIESARDFISTAKDAEIPSQIKARTEYGHLMKFADMNMRFCHLLPQLKHKYKTTMDNHLAKYCISFIDEGDAGDIKCVQDYDVAIKSYNEQSDCQLEAHESNWREFQDNKCPFVDGFLEDGFISYKLMDDASNALLGAAEIMKTWVSHDRSYPDKLWHVIINSNTKRNTLLECLKGVQRKRNVILKRQRKLEGFRDHFAQKLETEKKERKKIRHSLEVTESLIERNANDRKSTKEQMAEVEDQIAKRKSNSPKYLDILWDKLEKLKMEVARYDEKDRNFTEHRSRLKKSEDEMNSVVKTLEGEVAEYNYDIKDEGDEIGKMDKDIQQFQLDLQATEKRISTAKRVREFKLDPAYLKKIFYQKLQGPASDNLNDACQLVARKIGKSWPVLYQNLPFSPRRDTKRKDQDVEFVYISCLRRDKTMSEQALQSLLKWRVLNRQNKPNVDQLVKALRKIDQPQIARTLTKQFAKTQSI